MKRILGLFLLALAQLAQANPYYTASGYPAQGVQISSAPFRAEYTAIQNGFNVLPSFVGNNSKLWRINSTGTAIEVFTPTYADLTLTNVFSGATNTFNAVVATTFSGAGTGLTGTASGLSIGGNATTATTATTATNQSGGTVSATTLSASGAVSGAGMAAYMTAGLASSQPVVASTINGSTYNPYNPASVAITGGTISGINGLQITGGAQLPGYISKTSATGMTIGAITGTIYDFQLTDAANAHAVMAIPTGTYNALFAGNVTVNGTVNGSAYYINGNLLASATAPTITGGFGTSPSMTMVNGTSTFGVQIGSGGTAFNGTFTMPPAPNGWSCMVNQQNGYQPNSITKQNGGTTTQVSITNYSISTGASLAWAAGSIYELNCIAF